MGINGDFKGPDYSKSATSYIKVRLDEFGLLIIGKPIVFKFCKDVYKVMNIMLKKYSDSKGENKYFWKNPDIYIKKEGSDCYFEVVGYDETTKILIVEDSMQSIYMNKYPDCYVMSERVFLQRIDEYRYSRAKYKLECGGMSDESIGVVLRDIKDMYKNADYRKPEYFDLYNLCKYYIYLRDQVYSLDNLIIQYSDPDKIIANAKGKRKTIVSKSDKSKITNEYGLCTSDLRIFHKKEAILKEIDGGPNLVIPCISDIGRQSVAYVYEREYEDKKYRIVIVEPIGRGRQYQIVLNAYDNLNEAEAQLTIINQIGKILSMDDDSVRNYPNVIRRNHIKKEENGISTIDFDDFKKRTSYIFDVKNADVPQFEKMNIYAMFDAVGIDLRRRKNGKKI